jgi:hypothetical protein
MWQLDFSHRCHVSFYLSTLAVIGNDAEKVMWQRGSIVLAQPGIARYHKKMLCKLLCKFATPLSHRNCLFQYARGHAAIPAIAHSPDEPKGVRPTACGEQRTAIVSQPAATEETQA